MHCCKQSTFTRTKKHVADTHSFITHTSTHTCTRTDSLTHTQHSHAHTQHKFFLSYTTTHTQSCLFHTTHTLSLSLTQTHTILTHTHNTHTLSLFLSHKHTHTHTHTQHTLSLFPSHTQDLERFIASFNALMEHTSHVEQQLRMQQEGEGGGREGGDVETAEDTLTRHDQIHDQLRKAPQNTIREGNELLRRLEQVSWTHATGSLNHNTSSYVYVHHKATCMHKPMHMIMAMHMSYEQI